MPPIAAELEWPGTAEESGKIAKSSRQAVPVTGELVSTLHAGPAVPIEQGYALPSTGHG